MPASHPDEQGRFAHGNKPDAMADRDLRQLKFLERPLRHQLQLMLSHFAVRFVIDSGDFRSLFRLTDDSPEVDYRPGF